MYLKKFIIAIICCFIIINSSIYGSFQRFSKRPVASNVVTSSSKAASTLLTSTRPYHQEAQLYHQYTPALTKAAGENVVPEVAYNSFSPLTTQPLLLQAPLDRKKAGKIFFDALQQRAQGKTVQYDDSPESQAARQVIEETVPAYEQAEAQFAKEEKEGTVNYDLADQTRTELYKNQLRSLLKHGIITSTEHDALLSNFQIAMDDLKERRNAQRMRNETQERSSAAHEKAAKVLGVSKNASQKEINAAYKKAAFKAHPDRGGSEAEMKRINQARDVLLGKQKVFEYDEQERAEEKGPKKPFFSTKDKLAAGAIITVPAGIEAIEIRDELKKRAERTKQKQIEDLQPKNRPENMTDSQLTSEKYSLGYTPTYYALGYDRSPYTNAYSKNRLTEINAELIKRHQAQEQQRASERTIVYETYRGY